MILILFFLILLNSSEPIRSLLNLPHHFYIILFIGLSGIVFLKNKKFWQTTSIPIYFTVLIFIQLIYSIFIYLYLGATYHILSSLFLMINSFIFWQFTKTDYVNRINFYIIRFSIIISFLSFASLVLFKFIPHVHLNFDSNIQTQSYKLIYLTFTNSDLSGYLFRPSGIFDEPGSFSFFVSIGLSLILLDNANVSKRLPYIFLISLINLTIGSLISLFFLLLLIFYYRSKLINKYVLIGLLPILITILPEVISNLISKFQFVNGRFVGDNRSEQFYYAFNHILNNFDFFMIGSNILNPSINTTSNPLTIFLQLGFIHYLIYLLIILRILYISVVTRVIGLKILSLLFVFVVLHRPYIYNIFWAPIFMYIYFYINNYFKGWIK